MAQANIQAGQFEPILDFKSREHVFFTLDDKTFQEFFVEPTHTSSLALAQVNLLKSKFGMHVRAFRIIPLALDADAPQKEPE